MLVTATTSCPGMKGLISLSPVLCEDKDIAAIFDSAFYKWSFSLIFSHTLWDFRQRAAYALTVPRRIVLQIPHELLTGKHYGAMASWQRANTSSRSFKDLHVSTEEYYRCIVYHTYVNSEAYF